MDWFTDRKPDGEASEREPFLGQTSPGSSGVVVAGPVKLTPGWEDALQSGDDFDNISSPPIDRYVLFLSHSKYLLSQTTSKGK